MSVQIRLLILLIIVRIVGNPLYGQVNTEAMRRESMSNGFITTISVRQQLSRGNSDFSIVKGSARLDYLHNKYHTFTIANFKQGREQGEKFINKGFVHGRSVYRFSQRFSAELFGQIEFDDFIRLQRRELLGVGLRSHIWGEQRGLGWYLGTGFMNEAEHYTMASEGTKNLFRSTNYLTGKIKLNDIVNVFLTAYYQVDVGNFPDYRILLDSGLKVTLWKTISLIVDMDSRYDNEPLPGIKKHDLQLANGLQIEF